MNESNKVPKDEFYADPDLNKKSNFSETYDDYLK